MCFAPRDGRKYELVNGRLIVVPVGMQEAAIATELLCSIMRHLVAYDLGVALGSNVGYELPVGQVLSPDVSFVGWPKLPERELPETFSHFAPDLAVEIVSPSDSMTAVEQKVELYLQNGTQLVWVINPDLRRATVHRADGTVAVVRADTDGRLDGEAVLPGFACALAEIL